MSILATGLLTTLAFSSVDFEIETGVRAEARSGWMAVEADESVPGADFELTPLLQLALRSPSTTAAANYRPRFFYRYPNHPEARPLILHQVDASSTHSFNSQWSALGRAYLATGEVDFSRGVLLFGGAGDPGAVDLQPTELPSASVIRFNNIGASTEVTHQIDSRQQVIFTASAADNRPHEDDTRVFPTQQWFEMGSIHNVALSQIDSLSSGATVGLGIYSPGPTYYTLQPSTTWTRTSRRAVLTARLGLLAAQQEDSGSSSTHWLPIGEIGYTRRWRMGPRTIATAGARMGATSYFDPVAATLDPRGFVTLIASVGLPPDMAIRLNASLFSPISLEPQQPGRNPTLALFGVALDYAVASNLRLEAGCRAHTYAPHFSESWDKVTGIEAIAFVALTAGFDLVD